MANTFGVESEQAPANGGCAERSTNRCRMPAALEEYVASIWKITSHPDPHRHLDANRRGDKRLSATPAGRFSQRQNRRDDARARMQHRRQMGIVKVEAVRQRAVDQGRVR